MSDVTQEELDPQETLEFVVDVLLPEIEDGVYDKHIRQIARACFKRRDVINGTENVVPDKDEEPKPPQEKPLDGFMGNQALPENSRVALTPGKRAIRGEKTFYLGSNRYYCSEFIGRVFEIPANVSTQGLRGLFVRIDDFDVNKSVTRFNATLLENPTNNRVKRYKQGSKMVFPVTVLTKYTVDGYGL